MGSSFRYRSCSCSKVASSMSPFHRSCRGRRNSASARPARPLQFPRDKVRFLSKGARMFRFFALVGVLILCALPLRAVTIPAPTLSTRVVISVRDQKLMLIANEEKTIGRPASFGCIRMRSIDVTALYNQLPLGAPVEIVQDPLPKASKMADPEVYGFDAPASGPKRDSSQTKIASGPRA